MEKRITVKLGREIEDRYTGVPCKIITVIINNTEESGYIYPNGKYDDDGKQVKLSLNSYDNVALRGNDIVIDYNSPEGIIYEEILTKKENKVINHNVRDEQRAKEYDDLNNEGGEGYNPYK